MGTLTDAGLRKAVADAGTQTKPRLLWDEDGLVFTIMPSGTATAFFSYRPAGDGHAAPKRYRLGRYPRDVSLKQARDLVTSLRGKLRDGIDPGDQRNAAIETREREAAAATVSQLSAIYLATKSRRRRPDYYAQLYKVTILPALGSKKAAKVTAEHITAMLDPILTRGSSVMARRVYDEVRSLFKWAADKKRIPASPMSGVDQPDDSKPRERKLSNSELRALWAELGSGRLSVTYQRIIKLCLLTGQRSGEVAGMLQSELSDDLRKWTLPPARSKNKKEHSTPLMAEARALVRAAKADAGTSPYVFPSATDPKRPSAATSTRMWHISNRLAFIDPATNEPAPIAVHDLRRTFATRLEELHQPVPRIVVEVLLNHTSKGVTGKHYAQSDTTLDKADALAKWERAVADVLAGDDPFRSTSAADLDAIEARHRRPDGGAVTRLRAVS